VFRPTPGASARGLSRALEQVVDIECTRPPVEVGLVETAAIEFADGDDVAQRALGRLAAGAVPEQLAEDGVLWGLHVEGDPRRGLDALAAIELGAVEGALSAQEHVDLGEVRQEVDVPRAAPPRLASERVPVGLEVRAKRGDERADVGGPGVDTKSRSLVMRGSP
jgi:hypothetical protein